MRIKNKFVLWKMRTKAKSIQRKNADVLREMGIQLETPKHEAPQKQKPLTPMEDAEACGEVFCTQAQMQSVYNISYNGKYCPVCGGQLEIDDNWEFCPTVGVREKVEGVFEGYAFSNELEQKYQVVEKEKVFPARLFRCPHCEWKLLKAEYVSYEFRKFDGTKMYADTPSHLIERRDWNLIAKEFYRGKLYNKVNIIEDCVTRYRFRKKFNNL